MLEVLCLSQLSKIFDAPLSSCVVTNTQVEKTEIKLRELHSDEVQVPGILDF